MNRPRSAASAFFGVASFLAVAGLALAQPAANPYQIEFDQGRDVAMLDRHPDGKDGLFIKVRFRVTLDGAQVRKLDGEYRIVIEEDGKQVRVVDVPQPSLSDSLAAVLAMDTSGSMGGYRVEQAREAAKTFLDKLPAKAECGLILFDHQIRLSAPIGGDRQGLLRRIQSTEPRGGTAYLDAAAKAIEMLGQRGDGSERALVVMTDGVDLNSDKTLEFVIEAAKAAGVRVYPIGIGEPGKGEIVSTALVLDHSGSMASPADETENIAKIVALHEAGKRFVRSISPTGRVMLLPFNSRITSFHREFTQDRAFLADTIARLQPRGETALFDAVDSALSFLEADGTKGKRAVVAMTDGIDNSSRRRRPDEVIRRAQQLETPLYMLGFGLPGQLDERIMKRMAEQTGGQYHHARNRDSLVEIFEKLAIQLHDDGIDEITLKRLAKETGGEYFPAKNVADLKFVLEKVSASLQQESYEIVFPSLRQVRDGTQRNVALKLVRRSGSGDGVDTVVQQQTGRYQTQGLVVAEVSHLVYLGFLIVIGGLIAAPTILRKMTGRQVI